MGRQGGRQEKAGSPCSLEHVLQEGSLCDSVSKVTEGEELRQG